MAAWPHDARDGQVFTRIGSGNQPTRSTRSWTSNGVHYTVDTTSYSSPGISFGSVTGSANGPFRSFTSPAQPFPRPSFGGGGLFGSAFGLLEDILSISQPQHAYRDRSMGQKSSSTRKVHIDVESDSDDDDLEFEDREDGRSRPRTVLGRLKNRLLDSKQRPQRHGRDHSRGHAHEHSDGSDRERSPARSRPRMDRRQSSYRTEMREPDWPPSQGRQAPEFIEVDYEEEHSPPPQYRSRPEMSNVDADTIETLENTAELEQRAVRACKKRLEQASRQPGISSHYLQRLVNQLKEHEDALTNAQGRLDEARAKQQSARPRPRSTAQPPRPTPQQRQSMPLFDDDFFGSAGVFEPSFGNPRMSRQTDPIFRAFEEINSFGPFGLGAHERLFEHMRRSADDQPFTFYTTGTGPPPTGNNQRKRTRFSMPNGGQAFPQPMPGFANFAPPPGPPATLLKPDEAKQLFKTYNERWQALSATDANVPFPARGLQAHALKARDTLWAPLCNTPISTWSDETVMTANAQAFYLGVVGLAPVYKEAPGTGSIEMGFEKSKASAGQVKQLVDILKKEKMRWHSDRLGRRNGGMSMPNEALQKDERARAVFHAVCDLMESAQ